MARAGFELWAVLLHEFQSVQLQACATNHSLTPKIKGGKIYLFGLHLVLAVVLRWLIAGMVA